VDLSTRASRHLHKCRENDTICVLSSKAISAVAAFLYQWFCDFLCCLEVAAAELQLCFVTKGNLWWKRTFPPMATILALH